MYFQQMQGMVLAKRLQGSLVCHELALFTSHKMQLEKKIREAFNFFQHFNRPSNGETESQLSLKGPLSTFLWDFLAYAVEASASASASQFLSNLSKREMKIRNRIPHKKFFYSSTRVLGSGQTRNVFIFAKLKKDF